MFFKSIFITANQHETSHVVNILLSFLLIWCSSGYKILQNMNVGILEVISTGARNEMKIINNTKQTAAGTVNTLPTAGLRIATVAR